MKIERNSNFIEKLTQPDGIRRLFELIFNRNWNKSQFAVNLIEISHKRKKLKFC